MHSKRKTAQPNYEYQTLRPFLLAMGEVYPAKKVGGWTTVECLMAHAGGVEVSQTRCSRGQ